MQVFLNVDIFNHPYGIFLKISDCYFSLNSSGMHVTAGIDTERERIYQKSEQIDAQLQRMSEDLKVAFVNDSFYTTPILVRLFIRTASISVSYINDATFIKQIGNNCAY